MTVRTEEPFAAAPSVVGSDSRTIVRRIRTTLRSAIDCIAVYTDESMDVLYASESFSDRTADGYLQTIATDTGLEAIFGDSAREQLYSLGRFDYTIQSYADGSVLRVGLSETAGVLLIGSIDAYSTPQKLVAEIRSIVAAE
ncbi:MAG: hypothetical protein ACQETB_02395 [Halobacteriota archaeon]